MVFRNAPSASSADRRSGAPPSAVRRYAVAGVLAGVGVLMIGVGLLRSGGAHVVAIVMGLLLLLVLERTVGDWLIDVIGARARNLMMALVLAGFGWTALSPAAWNGALTLLGLDRYWSVKVPRGGWTVPPSATSSNPAPAGHPAPPAAGPGGGASARAHSVSTDVPERGAPARGARVRLRSVSAGDSVRLEAAVSAEGPLEGVVEFFIDGRRVATARVGQDGRAEAQVPDPGPGTHRVTVRFKGGRGASDVTSETTLVR